MSDEDDSSKTEEPTGKKLSEAAQRGDVPRSQEVNHFVILLGATMLIATFGATIAQKLRGELLNFFERPQDIPADKGQLIALAWELSINIALVLAPMFGAIILFAFLSSAIQVKPQIASKKWENMLEGLNPINGFSKIFNKTALVELGKNIIKLIIISAAMTYAIGPDFKDVGLLITMEPVMQLRETERLTMVLLKTVLGVLFALAVADYLFQRFRHHEKMKMTKQEVKEEHKQQEGDPLIKGKLRALRMQKARSRMMAAVPGADVVVTNPTHYAVALKYDQATMRAPMMVAKGADHVALKIRSIATESNVPIVENPPLARALYTLDLEAEIPELYYRAVAEVITFVMRLKRRLPGAVYRPKEEVVEPPQQSRGRGGDRDLGGAP